MRYAPGAHWSRGSTPAYRPIQTHGPEGAFQLAGIMYTRTLSAWEPAPGGQGKPMAAHSGQAMTTDDDDDDNDPVRRRKKGRAAVVGRLWPHPSWPDMRLRGRPHLPGRASLSGCERNLIPRISSRYYSIYTTRLCSGNFRRLDPLTSHLHMAWWRRSFCHDLLLLLLLMLLHHPSLARGVPRRTRHAHSTTAQLKLPAF